MPHLIGHLHNYSHKVILGDLKADQLLSNADDAVFVRQLIINNLLKLVQNGAKYHTRLSDTWLDFCIVDGLYDAVSH